MSVPRPERLIGGVSGMGGAEPLRVLATAEELRRLQCGDGESRPEHRHIDMTSGSAVLNTSQRCRDGKGSVEARRKISDRNTTLYWRATRLACNAHDAGHGLQREIESALLGAWSRLPVRGYRAVYQFGVVSADFLVAEPEACHHAGPIVLNEYVGCADQIAGALDMVRVLEVECHRSFVPVQGSEVLAESVGQRWPAPHRVPPVRVLDLDDVRSHIREKHAAERAGRYVAEFDDVHAAERKHCALHVQHSGQLLTDMSETEIPCRHGRQDRSSKGAISAALLRRTGGHKHDSDIENPVHATAHVMDTHTFSRP